MRARVWSGGNAHTSKKIRLEQDHILNGSIEYIYDGLFGAAIDRGKGGPWCTLWCLSCLLSLPFLSPLFHFSVIFFLQFMFVNALHQRRVFVILFAFVRRRHV
jgi:hypothetical protein